MRDDENVFVPKQIRTPQGEIVEGFLPDQVSAHAKRHWLALEKKENCTQCTTMYMLGFRKIPILNHYFGPPEQLSFPILICSCK